MIYKEIKQDIFTIDSKYALGHCISLDCKMGAGISVEFVKRHPKMRDELKKCIQDNNLSFPTIIGYTDNGEIVLNLINKEKSWHKPTNCTIRECIRNSVVLCNKMGIKYLALPKIGCGIDKLNWEDVKEIIKEEFKDTDIEILICIK